VSAAGWGWVAATTLLATLAWAGHAIGRALNADPFNIFTEEEQ
jgi:hypothetical protein